MKKIITTAAAIITVAALNVSALAFSDIDASNAVLKTAAEDLQALKVMRGYGDGTFNPNGYITRAETVQLRANMLGQTQNRDLSNYEASAEFEDLKKEHWAYGIISYTMDSSTDIKGYQDGTFRPDNNVTYAEMLKLMVTVLGYHNLSKEELSYPDGYLECAAQIGLTKDVAAFNADDAVTRADAAVIARNTIDTPCVITTAWSAKGDHKFAVEEGYTLRKIYLQPED